MVKKVKYFLNGIWASLILLGICFSHNGCKDEFTTDSEYKLTMPDSLSFDTVISQTISPTAVFKIYNETKEDIKIASLVLESHSNYFQINVNGKSGTSFSNLEILSGDSLYVFVQIVAGESGQDAPLLIEDKINVLYNGNCQSVVLSAYGQDAYHLKQKVHISSDTVWSGKKPFLVYDSIIVDSAATLTIKEGVVLYMKKNATILVNGSIHIEGSVDEEVVFLTNRIDNISRELEFDQMTNLWGGINISSSSTDNRINHALIKGGAFGILVDSAVVNGDDYSLVISNSHIHNTYGSCLYAYKSNVMAYNSLFTNGTRGCVVLQGGKHQFDHCTISLHNSSSYALTLSDKDYYAEPDSEDGLPFKAVFNNCIVAGDTVKFGKPRSQINVVPHVEVDSLDFKFDHSLLFIGISPEDMAMDTNRFNVVIPNENPRFQCVDRANSVYDFHLMEDSPCKERGDLGLVLRNEAYKLDKDGVLRNVDAAPDMGAYQIVVKADTSVVNQ